MIDNQGERIKEFAKYDLWIPLGFSIPFYIMLLV